VGFFSDPMLVPTTKGSKRPLKYRLSDEELRQYVIWEIAVNSEIIGMSGTCSAGLSDVALSAQGKVFPCICLRIEAGDLRKGSFQDIWNSSSVFHRIRGLNLHDFEHCARCDLLNICRRCPGWALDEQGDMLLPPKEACRVTKMRKEVILNE